MTHTDYIGSLGVALILLAYILTLFKILKTNHILYIVLNLIGAVLACFASILLNYLPFIILEGVWALVSGIALLKFFTKSIDA